MLLVSELTRQRQALQLRRSRLLKLVIGLTSESVRSRLLQGVMGGGALYALTALVLGGVYEYPWQIVGIVFRLHHTVVRTLLAYLLRGCQPLYPEWTLRFEVVRALLHAVMATYGDRMLQPKNAQWIRWQSEWAGSIQGYITARKLGVSVEPVQHNGLEHLWLRSRALASGKPSGRRMVVLYFHGGGFALLSPRMYISMASELQTRITRVLRQQYNDEGVQVEILLANYRKTPEHAYPIPPEDALCMYEYLLSDPSLSPQQIVLAGDSAGGALALTTLLRVRDQQPHQLPLAALLSCPYVDLEEWGCDSDAPHCIIGESAGPTVNRLYFPGKKAEPSTWGDASPVHCDLSGLPPVYILAAGLDFIRSHSHRLMAKAQADGATDWELDVHEGFPHVYLMFPLNILPAASKGIDSMAQYAARAFAQAPRPASSA